MRPTSSTIRTLSVLLLLISVGCDRQSSSSQNGDPTTDQASEPIQLAVSLTPITPLLPRLRTHVAVDSHGNLYWIQESERVPSGGDLVFVMGDSGVPQTIPALSVPRLLAALGLDTAAGAGAIHSIAVGPSNDLYVLFTGGKGRTPICAVARYSPSTAKVKIVADTQRLMDASGMGPSIELARGSLVSEGQNFWLWLRHSDAASVIQFVPLEGGTNFDLRPMHFKPPLEARIGQLTSESEDLSAGPGQNLYYVDRPRAMLWKIDAAGEYTAFQSLDGFSGALTAPAVDDAGRLCTIAGEGDPLVPTAEISDAFTPKSAAPAYWVQLAYPAFVQVEPSATGAPVLTTIKRDDFLGPSALPIQDLQPRQLLLDQTNGTLITFDAASGELLRLKLMRK
jgi:hypothetical protein